MNKKRFLKSILATSALAAAIAPGAAFGTGFYLQNNPSDTGTMAHFNDQAGGGGAVAADIAAISAADNIFLNGANVEFKHDQAANVTIKNLDRNGVANGIISHAVAGQTVTVESVVNAAQADKDVTLRFDNPADGTSTINITAATAGLKNIGTLDAKNRAGIFKLNPGNGNVADYTGREFKSTGGDNGTVDVASGTVKLGTFAAAAGTSIAKMTIADGATAVTTANIVLSHADIK